MVSCTNEIHKAHRPAQKDAIGRIDVTIGLRAMARREHKYQERNKERKKERKKKGCLIDGNI